MASRYYFHLLEGTVCIPDQEGIALEDVDLALVYASDLLKELRDTDPSVCDEWRGWRLEIVDSSGRAVHTLPLDGFDPERSPLS